MDGLEGWPAEDDLEETDKAARQQDLKSRRRVTKALAAKRSRKQHGLFVQSLSEECEGLRERITGLKLKRESDAVARKMIGSFANALSAERAAVLNSWIQKTPLVGMLAQAEEREREREAERSARIAKDEERQRQSCGSSPSLHPAGSPSLHQSRS